MRKPKTIKIRCSENKCLSGCPLHRELETYCICSLCLIGSDKNKVTITISPKGVNK